MIVLLPRLPGPAAEGLLDRFLAHGPAGWAGFNPYDLPEAVRFAATGGSRINPRQLDELREVVLRVAGTNGLGAAGDRASHARFDAEMGSAFAEMSLLASGEALRDDVWTFIGVALAPDVVHCRFGAARERYLGGVRNTFQRLWLRVRALDRGSKHPERWQLLEELTEDALVQITERPSIGSDPILARAVAEAWLRAGNHHGRGAMEPIMRRAVLRVRIWNEIRSLADLPPDILARTLDEVFGLPAGSEEKETSLGGLPSARGKGVHALPGSEESKPNRRQGGIPASESDDTIHATSRAASRVLTAAKQRRWISPKSTAALTALKEGQRDLARSDQNALLHLLWRMSAAALLPEEVTLVSRAVSTATQDVTRAAGEE